MHSRSVHNLTDLLGGAARLGELLEPRGLEDVLASFYTLFRIPARVLDAEGHTLARSRKPSALNEYLGQLARAKARLGDEHLLLRTREPDDTGEFTHTAFSGASYHVSMIGHDGRRVGRLILGPFITPELEELPPTLTAADPAIDPRRARELLLGLPRLRPDTLRAIGRHLTVTLDALIFAGHRALLSEHMHLSTVQENQRQLSAKDEGLLAAEQRLFESGRSQAEFLVSALTELRTPLEGILGQSERLAAAERLHPEQRDVVLGIHERAEQLLGLSRQLLDFSRAHSGALSLRPQALEVPSLLDRVARRLREAAPARARDVQVTCEPALPRLEADAEALEQALTLLGQYALRSAGRGAVGLSAARAPASDSDDSDALVLLGAPPQRLELRVSDQGPGVRDADKERIFEPFRQPGGAAGAGLDLATAKRLTLALGGSVWVEDNVPRGACFVISLPAAPSAPL